MIVRGLQKALIFFDRIPYYYGRVVAKSKAAVWFPGRNTVLDYTSIVKYPEKIEMGNHVWIGSAVSIGAYRGMKLGDRVRISHGAFIETASLNVRGEELPYAHVGKPIVIGEGVWIGSHAVILGGVTIGERAVIGAGAIVTKDVPAHAIVVGNIASVIGSREKS